LSLAGDLLRVIPRNDIYIRYLNDNRGSIGELASELYGRKLRVEVSVNGAAVGAATGGAVSAPPVAAPASAASTAGATSAMDAAGGAEDGATRSVAPSSAPEQPAIAASAPAAAAATDSPPPPPQTRSIAADRQALYADPVVRRIFEELQGRLVDVREVRREVLEARREILDVREPAATPSAPPPEAPAPLSVSASNDPASPAMRRRLQE
jgi:pyruvate dehydrogenase E2 component (dihydrolipoamide acetyltransferase)